MKRSYISYFVVLILFLSAFVIVVKAEIDSNPRIVSISKDSIPDDATVKLDFENSIKADLNNYANFLSNIPTQIPDEDQQIMKGDINFVVSSLKSYIDDKKIDDIASTTEKNNFLRAKISFIRMIFGRIHPTSTNLDDEIIHRIAKATSISELVDIRKDILKNK